MSVDGFYMGMCKFEVHMLIFIGIYLKFWEHNDKMLWHYKLFIQGESLARGPKLLSMYTVEQCRFLVCEYWQTGSFKACQMAFQTEFGERHAPLKCSIQKLVKKLETRGSRSNTCRLLSFGAY